MIDKVIVTGSGHCGTSYVMRLLSILELDTGYTAADIDRIDKGRKETARRARGHGFAGLEWWIEDNIPYIIKGHTFCANLLSLATKFNWTVQHVYLVLRKFDEVADHVSNVPISRHNVPEAWVKENPTPEENNGLYASRAASDVGSLLLQVSSEEIPCTVLMFPRIVTDPQYLFTKLEFVLNNMSYDTFLKGFNVVADRKQVHYGELKDTL